MTERVRFWMSPPSKGTEKYVVDWRKPKKRDAWYLSKLLNWNIYNIQFKSEIVSVNFVNFVNFVNVNWLFFLIIFDPPGIGTRFSALSNAQWPQRALPLCSLATTGGSVTYLRDTTFLALGTILMKGKYDWPVQSARTILSELQELWDYPSGTTAIEWELQTVKICQECISSSCRWAPQSLDDPWMFTFFAAFWDILSILFSGSHAPSDRWCAARGTWPRQSVSTRTCWACPTWQFPSWSPRGVPPWRLWAAWQCLAQISHPFSGFDLTLTQLCYNCATFVLFQSSSIYIMYQFLDVEICWGYTSKTHPHQREPVMLAPGQQYCYL